MLSKSKNDAPRDFILVVLLPATSVAGAEDRVPNLILIIADDLGYGDWVVTEADP